jgi:hypothetical protein
MEEVSLATHFVIAAILVATFGFEVNSFVFENYSYVVLYCLI